MLLAPLSAFGADPADGFVSLASDPARQQEMAAKIAEWKLAGGVEDFTPLAMKLVKASRDQVKPEAALTLAELAVLAAPGDPAVQHRMMGAALDVGDSGRAIRAGVAWLKAWFADPWLYPSTLGRATMAIAVAALIATIAILLCSIPYYLPLAIHDLGDRFPENARKYAPVGGMLLVAAAFFSAGGGAAAFIVVPALVVILYAPLRVRVALVLLIPVAMLVFPAALTVEKMAGKGGDRAFALYRVWKGDSGADLEEEIAKNFGGSSEYRSLVARAFSARRSGEAARARSLLFNAANAPGADMRFISSNLGAVEYILGNVGEAAEHYRRASEANPSDWRSWYNLAAIRLAQLDLAGAETARARANEISPAEVEKQQRVAADAGGNIYPAFENFPPSWVAEAVEEAPSPENGWAEAMWSWLGFSFGVLRPTWMLGVMLVGLLWAKGMDKFRPSRRCVSCGAIKCPRCHRLIKDPNLCAGCWAMNNENAIDPESRRRQRESITWWTMETRSARKWGATLIPGWNTFIYSGGIGSAIAGVLWALAAGIAVAESVVRIPLGSWAGTALVMPSLIALAAIYLIGGINSLRN